MNASIPWLLLGLAYLLGSTPFAYIAGRLRGIDLRQHGSGNLGATNVLRTLGAPAAIVVLLLDALKGVVPVMLFPRLAAVDGMVLWAMAYGIAAIAGHVRPYFGLFRGGGKGVATAAGVFAALAPIPFLAALAVFVVTVVATRYVSLGSLVAAVTLPVGVLIEDGTRSPLLWLSVLVCAFVFWTHRSNIGRLRRGEESRIGRRTSPNTAGA